jgi:insulysin
VRDLNVTKSAASLSVKVGSANDPRTRPGLAHFVEHMLFMGTKTYPDENEYNMFIKDHSGYSNAFTDMGHTVYFFKVDKEHFAEALQRFAAFFYEPLFKADTVERERKAVHAEFACSVSSEAWRFEQLQRHLANPDSLFNRFVIGDENTLAGDTVREEMLEFYQRSYSANLMKVCLIGPYPLAEMESAARTLFSNIPNHGYTPLASDIPTFPEGHRGMLVRYKSAEERHKLVIKHFTKLLIS